MDIVMVTLPRHEYSKSIADLVTIFGQHNNTICYVSLNKPEKTLLEMFNEEKINANKFLIIDCISAEQNSYARKKGTTLFVSSPKSLTKLSLATTEALSLGIEGIFFDALSTLLIYQDSIIVVRFAHNIITKLRALDKKGIFVVLREDVNKPLLDDLSMFVDEVLEIGVGNDGEPK